MPSAPTRCKALLLTFLLYASLAITPGFAEDFGAKVHYADLVETGETYHVNTEIIYKLSPTATEALHKGVPLTWEVIINLSHSGLFGSTVFSRTLPYTLLFNALLNQYEVKTSGQLDMFLSLNAALNFMAQLHDAVQIDKALIEPGKNYQLAIKARFNRELLPIPLRPVAWLDGQWYLSSNWFVCSTPK